MAILASDMLLDDALERSRKEKRPVSELLFEACCEKVQIGCRRIPEQDVKTPDYEISIGGQTIFAEVKELKEDWKPGVVKSETVGNRIRRKIDQCGQQLKPRTAEQHPGMLVLYREGGCNYFDVHLQAAMYGTTVVEIAIPGNGQRNYATGKEWFGPGKK